MRGRGVIRKHAYEGKRIININNKYKNEMRAIKYTLINIPRLSFDFVYVNCISATMLKNGKNLGLCLKPHSSTTLSPHSYSSSHPTCPWV